MTTSKSSMKAVAFITLAMFLLTAIVVNFSACGGGGGGGSDGTPSSSPSATSPSPEMPSADFEASPVSGDKPLNVGFTDKSTGNPTSWNWNFGDGNRSTLQNPSHQYDSAGIYPVTLIVKNAAGASTKTKNNYIIVNETGVAPIAEFEGTPVSGPAPLTVSFTDQSANNPTSWNWNFGDGNNSTDKNPTHQYDGNGTYTVTMTATNAFGSDSETKTGYIVVSSETATLNITVRDELGALVADVEIEITQGGITLYTGKTNKDGFCQITGVVRGGYGIILRKSGYSTSGYSDDFQAGENNREYIIYDS